MKRVKNTMANAMYINALPLDICSIYEAIAGVKIIAGMV